MTTIAQLLLVTVALLVPLLGLGIWMRRRLFASSSPVIPLDMAAANLGATLVEDRAILKRGHWEVIFDTSGELADCINISMQPAKESNASEDAQAVDFVSPILARTENAVDRVGKALSLNREIQTGFGAFDEAVYIETNAPEKVVLTTFSSERLRSCVLSLLDRGYEGVRFYGDRGLVTVERSRPDGEMLTDVELRATLALMDTIATQLPEFAPRYPEGEPRALWFQVWMGVVALTMISPLAYGYLRPFTHQPLASTFLWDVFTWAGIAWCASIPVWWLALRGMSTSLRAFLMFAGISLAAYPIVGYQGVRVLNATLDNAPAHTETVKVREMWRSGESQAECNVLVEKPRPGVETAEIHIPCEMYKEIKPEHVVKVTTRPGSLGFFWLESIERVVP